MIRFLFLFLMLISFTGSLQACLGELDDLQVLLLKDLGIRGKVIVSFDNPQDFPKIERNKCTRLLKILHKSDRKFSAILSRDGEFHRIVGSYQKILIVPMLIEPVNYNDSIEEHNVKMIEVLSSQVTPDTMLHKEDLINAQTRSRIPANAPISRYSIRLPVIVARNAIVNVSYERHNVLLEAKAIALEAGAKYDIIKMRNVATGTYIRGRVSGVNTVKIGKEY